jgi:hypothetical protein
MPARAKAAICGHFERSGLVHQFLQARCPGEQGLSVLAFV